jgi:hypothetical protein
MKVTFRANGEFIDKDQRISIDCVWFPIVPILWGKLRGATSDGDSGSRPVNLLSRYSERSAFKMREMTSESGRCTYKEGYIFNFLGRV